MGETTWKQYLKKLGKDFLIGVFDLFCFISGLSIVCWTLNEQQFNAVIELFIQRAVFPIFFMLLGVVFVGAGVEQVLKFIYKIIKNVRRN